MIQKKNQERKGETIIQQTRTREERGKLLSNKQKPGKKEENYYPTNKNQGRKRKTIIKQTRTREERGKLLLNKQEPGKKEGNYY